MACDLTKGRGLDCKDVMGGVKNMYIVPLDQATFNITSTNGELEDLLITTNPTNLYKYSLPRGTGALTETLTGSMENGTVFYEPSLNIKLFKLTIADRNEIKLLAQQPLLIFCELQQKYSTNGHNVIVAIGVENGMDLLTGTESSGTAFGDLNGYDLTFTGSEPSPMQFVADYTTTPFDNSTFTVTLVTS